MRSKKEHYKTIRLTGILTVALHDAEKFNDDLG
jgi:hypothetical protein